MSHGHSHECGGGEHSHDHPDADLGAMYSLYLKIDTERLQCLNEVIEGSGKSVFKPWDKRLDTHSFVESDADEELLFNIPFTGSVKLKGIIVIGGEDDKHPSKMRLFKNRPGMTFDDTSLQPEQEFDLNPDPEGMLEYSTKVARFNNVTHLSLHFPTNFGADSTKIYYIGLKGDFTQLSRQEIVICNYEAAAFPSDHKSEVINPNPHMVL